LPRTFLTPVCRPKVKKEAIQTRDYCVAALSIKAAQCFARIAQILRCVKNAAQDDNGIRNSFELRERR